MKDTKTTLKLLEEYKKEQMDSMNPFKEIDANWAQGYINFIQWIEYKKKDQLQKR